MLLLIKVLFFQQRAKLFSDFLNNVVCSNNDNKDGEKQQTNTSLLGTWISWIWWGDWWPVAALPLSTAVKKNHQHTTNLVYWWLYSLEIASFVGLHIHLCLFGRLSESVLDTCSNLSLNTLAYSSNGSYTSSIMHYFFRDTSQKNLLLAICFVSAEAVNGMRVV